MTGLTRLPGVAHALGTRSAQMLKDHVRRLTVQEHEVDRAVYKAMLSDATLPLEMRLQVAGRGRGRAGAQGTAHGGAMHAAAPGRCVPAPGLVKLLPHCAGCQARCMTRHAGPAPV